ncbi:Transcriptional regulator, AsnC family [Methanocella conradii HZ254]|uniref:Transcriptional regulator, AsnC family n=1 Tax=Methanocella conradii (strain DSM 24694 / JCM 17849 / CGMCC 1.5162 / HZ254) TaxID=1041930 RepID=H8IAA1_METCZ|nr:Lrp/AsnC family transcriptional regulator [Methanocella conradii]AFC99575.1 Transcriptional regulator, AsnC family [Methanocella conradii HZ254]MDI6897421.1 Lrp/AsnC family transcriptional regulator [Methanocella conradii]
MGKSKNKERPTGKSMREVLELLEKDSRLTAREIAEQTGLSEKDVERFIKEMEARGIIKRYKAIIDWEKYGDDSVYAIIEVQLNPERNVGYDAVAERISKFPEVVTCMLVSGDHDLHLVIKGRTMKEVAFFVAEKIAPLSQVTHTATHFMLRSYKQEGEIMFEKEEDSRLVIHP